MQCLTVLSVVFACLTQTVFCVFNSHEVKECIKKCSPSLLIVDKTEPAFRSLNCQYNLRNQIEPVGYLLVTDDNDVKCAISCGQQLQLKMSVKSGGHGDEKFAYGSIEHWIIDVSGINSIKISGSKKYVTVGAGVKLGNLTRYLWNNGHNALPYGDCYDIGISGFALGGGQSINSRAYGLMVDRIVSTRIVTANGSTLEANRNKNSDLFWALQGAGAAGFGVVTRLKLRLFHALAYFLQIEKNYCFPNFKLLFKRWQQWLASNPDHSIHSTFTVNKVNGITIKFYIFNTDSGKTVKLAKRIASIFPFIEMNDVKWMSFPETYQSINENKNCQKDHYQYRKSTYVSRQLDEDERENLNALIRQLCSKCVLILYALGGAINSKDPDDMAYCHRRSLYNFQVVLTTKDVNEGKAFENSVNKFFDRTKFMQENESYQNHVDASLVNHLSRYYCNNTAKLTEIKRKYDPLNWFNFNQSIPI